MTLSVGSITDNGYYKECFLENDFPYSKGENRFFIPKNVLAWVLCQNVGATPKNASDENHFVVPRKTFKFNFSKENKKILH